MIINERDCRRGTYYSGDKANDDGGTYSPRACFSIVNIKKKRNNGNYSWIDEARGYPKGYSV